jgi:hypothetical protein
LFQENAIFFLEVFDHSLLVSAHPVGDRDEQELELRRHRGENLSKVLVAQYYIWSRLNFLAVQGIDGYHLRLLPLLLLLLLLRGGCWLKRVSAVLAAKVERLSVAVSVERRRFIHRHSADGVFSHIRSISVGWSSNVTTAIRTEQPIKLTLLRS